MYNEIKQYLEKNVSEVRLEHSLATSGMCSFLCNHFGIDPLPGKLAGIAHDIARELPDEEQLALAQRDAHGTTTYERDHPVLLHGRAGAVLLSEQFGIADETILQAVRWHTTGHTAMGVIGKILFVADYIEPGRKYIDDTYRQKLFAMNLNAMVLDVLSKEISYLRNSGNTIVEESILLYDDLLLECGKNSGLKG